MISRRKIVIGVIVGVFAVVILMLAGVLIAPQVLDTKSVKDEIRSQVQKELGAKVDFKHLRLDFFPHPHVIFDQVTLSIPPGVKGKAVSVRVYPEILPLFRGKIQIASLRLDTAELDYTLTKKTVTEKRASQPFSLDELGKKVQSFVSTLPAFKIPELDYQVINSRVNLFDNGRQLLALSSVNHHLEGPPAGRKITLKCKSSLWQSISMSGQLNTTTFKGSGQVQFTQFRPQGLATYLLPDSAYQVVDAPADLTIDFKIEGPGQLQAEAHGSSPHLKFQYAKKELNIKNPRIKAALLVDKDSVTLSLSELALDKPQLNVTGKLAWNDIPRKTGSKKPSSEKRLSLDMDIAADTVDLLPLIQAMQKISAHNGGGKTPESKSIPLQGNIRFKADRFKIGKFTWNPVHADISFKTEGPGQVQAEIHGASPHLKFQYAKEELNIKNPRFKAALLVDKNSVILSLSELALDKPQLNVTGKLAWNDMQGKTWSKKPSSEKRLSLDMDIAADTVDLLPLIQAMQKISEHNGGGKTAKSQSIPLQGNIRFKADRFKIGKFTWNPLHADISLNNDTADITLKEAAICGISTPGTLKVSLPDIEFDLEAVAKDQELEPTKTCLVGETFKADGIYNLKGSFQGRGKAEDLLKTATGQVEFTAADGHIYHNIILLNVLTFLNTLEVLTGKVDVKDMGSKGFGYHSLRLKAKMQDGKLRYEKAVLHGQPMIVTAAGQHDLQNGRIDLTLLVAPLVTLERIFEHIPLIGGILDTLDTIPLSVKGTLDNIHIIPLAPSAIGYELEEMMKNTVERPINLIHVGKKPE